MSGHSKWATIKHRKGAADKARSKLFAKLIRGVEVAAREGGSDLESNATLRTMYQKARDNSVPLDTIERAIKRGTGELEGVSYEQVSYEGYAPHGVAMYVEVLTDNRNRTLSEIRSVFTRAGGSLAEPGAVAWQFDRRGIVTVPGDVAEDDVLAAALDAGARDVVAEGGVWQVTTDPAETMVVRDALEAAGIVVTSADLTYVAQNAVELTEASEAKKVMAVLDALDENDDVQGVYANFDVSDDLLESLAG
ncbi:MAG TPA: YebC/PmpR family DNA-binding transcriptional regulator [Acidimicrobiaceae bacterium]|nr:YebC/PmpR family DNA-binding transcriptional regulator [Acidimicrobiaceae bacterium]HCB37180.1 YebC/PmpR family DNA-binding transcriptional regulator [Acidimicrobiaceae bacterium]